VEVQSGGSLTVESNNPAGLNLIGDTVYVHAGGQIIVDRVTIKMKDLIIDQAGIITATGKVGCLHHYEICHAKKLLVIINKYVRLFFVNSTVSTYIYCCISICL
jgi:hypothetical protein